MMTGSRYQHFAMVMFTLAFLHDPCSVESSGINQKSFTKKEYCQGTHRTLQEVSNCPENEKNHHERSYTLQCYSYPPCGGELLVFHCVRHDDYYVEVCSPRTIITGGFCAKFDENIGRVVKDSSRICSECPENYNSDEYFKYSSCVTRMTSALKHSKENVKTSHTLSRAHTDDAYCDGQSCSSEPSRTTQTTSDNSQRTTTTHAYFSIPTTLISAICLAGLFLYCKMTRKVDTSEETAPVLQQKEVASEGERHGGSFDTRGNTECFQRCDDKRIEQPIVLNIKSDSVQLLCKTLGEKPDHYQVRFKNKKENSKWKSIETDSDENTITISELMADTVYIFQVRGIYGDEEGPFSPITEEIKTQKSLATSLLGICILNNDTNCTPIYLLPVKENPLARNNSARTRQLVLGTPSRDFNDEKTIMLVGATGSGKSTLVDGIVNYIMGVSFDDPFRFTMVTLEDEEKKGNNQAISQTEWITVYKIYPTVGSRLQYTLNIIDTPGFGDTRGIERDNAIVDQIRQLFSAEGDQGVLDIDAVCFIVKAPDARLTVVQKYIFSSIMSLFGKDIELNICTLITFADGANPPVIASLNESKLPFGSTFNFNNSALFAENKNLKQNTLSPMFWKMGCSSFESFFKHIQGLETKSLRQTKSVLDEREHLRTVILNIRPQVTAGLSKLSELQTQLDIFERFTNEIKENEDFEYEVEEIMQEMTSLPKGQHVTNCINCNVTCHEECKIPDDGGKRGCAAINLFTGYCMVCPDKCIWSMHKNTPYIFRYIPKKVKKTYAEMKKRHEDALGRTLTHEKYIEQLTSDLKEMFIEIKRMMNEMNNCKSRLKEIALKPDPLSTVEHIDLMIQSEETERKQGYVNRIKMLMEIKRMALVDEDVANFGQNIDDTLKTFNKLSETNLPNKKGNRKNVITRSYELMKKTASQVKQHFAPKQQ